MVLITEIFGKQKEITIIDFNTTIINKVSENDHIEYKRVFSLNIKEKEDLILKPLISFLNNRRGQGILFLGIEEKDGIARQIIPITREIIKGKEQLRSIIHNISSLPDLKNSFNIQIEEIQGENGVVYLIEINRNASECLFYSNLSNLAYIRKDDISQSLSPPEVMEFLSNIRYPKIFVIPFNPRIKDNTAKVDLIYANEGKEPGRYISAFITFPAKSENISDIQLIGERVRNISNINPDVSLIFQNIIGYPPTTIFIYPEVASVIGTLVLTYTGDNFSINCKIDCYEEKGRTNQEYAIVGNKENISIAELKRVYQKYI
jgi:hypothetical protein